MDANGLLTAIENECEQILERRDSHDYLFLTGPHRLMLAAEYNLCDDLVPLLVERVNKNSNSVACRVFLGSLRRLVPIDYLALLSRERKSALSSQREVFPTGMVDAIVTAAQSSIPDVAVTAMKLCSATALPESVEVCLGQLRHNDESVRRAAIWNSSRLVDVSESARNRLQELFYTTSNDEERLLAFDSLIVSDANESASNVETVYRDSSGLFVDSRYVDTLLDLGSSAMSSLIGQIIAYHSFREFPDSTLRRIRRSELLPNDLRDSCDHCVRETLTIEEGAEYSPNKTANAVHRNSNADSFFVGHAGIYIGNGEVIHCTTGSDPHAVHKISFDDWKAAGGEFWGFRWDRSLVGSNEVRMRIVDRAKEIASWRTEYDGAHNNQKGKWMKECTRRRWWGDCVRTRKYWEADCVGFTEHCFEHVGGNPTASRFEVGLGWPLTVREQRDSMALNLRS